MFATAAEAVAQIPATQQQVIAFQRAADALDLMRAASSRLWRDDFTVRFAASPQTAHADNLGDPCELAGFLVWRRYCAGGTPNARLNARLNAASDS